MNSESSSSSYAFYVELDHSEGLILGQHVYLEPDLGQEEEKTGLWLEDYYVIQENDKAYVWMANTANVIEKHEITLGEYDEELMKYEVTDGLDAEDYIAYPMDTIQEGDPVIYNDYMSMGLGGMNMDMGEMDMDGEMLSDPGADVFDLDADSDSGEERLDAYDADSDNDEDVLDLDEEADDDSSEDAEQEN